MREARVVRAVDGAGAISRVPRGAAPLATTPGQGRNVGETLLLYSAYREAKEGGEPTSQVRLVYRALVVAVRPLGHDVVAAPRAVLVIVRQWVAHPVARTRHGIRHQHRLDVPV